MHESEDTTKVVILTRSFRVIGQIALIPGARLTDFVIDARSFIAVTDAEVQDHAGNQLLKTPFLNVHRDQVEIILPAEVGSVRQEHPRVAEPAQADQAIVIDGKGSPRP